MFDEKVKSKLDNHETPVNPNLWNNIEQNLVNQGLTKTGSSLVLKKVLPLLGFGIVAIGSFYFLSSSKTENKKEKGLEAITTNNTVSQIQIDSKVTPTTITEQTDITTLAEKNLAESIQKVTPISKQEDLSSDQIEVVANQPEEIISSSKEISNAFLFNNDEKEIDQNITTPLDTEKAEVTDKLHAAGEYVTVRVDFQNYADETTTHMKMWEEFPDWVDVNTLEMVDQKNSIKIKTRIISAQNSVIWKVQGDFSNDVNSKESKGFLEYKIQLTEPTRASELEKLKPEIK